VRQHAGAFEGYGAQNEDYNRLLKLSGYFEIETGIAEACKQ
jgi:hypothetical protein